MLKNYTMDQIYSLAHTGSLIKGTAHNINTPLSSILGRADIIRLRLDRVARLVSDAGLEQEFEKFRRDVSLIIDNSNKLSALVKSTVYRCTKAVQNDVVPVNIAAILRDDLEFFMSDMEFKHNIEKRLSIDVAVPPIMGAPVHFSNAFTEIFANARDAMRDNDEKILTVSVSSDGAAVSVAVGDNGCGMDDQTRRDAVGILERPAESSFNGISGLAYTAWLLKPYNPCYRIDSRPGQTTVCVAFPV